MGWSGACWLLTSSTIDRIMNFECKGIELENPDGCIKANSLMSMFVDDAVQLCNSFQAPHQSIMDQTKQNLQLHSGLVYTNGGKLTHDKCKFYYICFSFNDDDKAYIREGAARGE